MSQNTVTADPAADLRADVARRQVPIYQLASRVGLHPSHLGQALRGRRPLSPELVERIKYALHEDDPSEPDAHPECRSERDAVAT